MDNKKEVLCEGAEEISLVSFENLNLSSSTKIKSVKIPKIIHTELTLLSSFIDESKTYIIIQKMIDSFVKEELTIRQQQQFKFILDALDKK